MDFTLCISQWLCLSKALKNFSESSNIADHSKRDAGIDQAYLFIYLVSLMNISKIGTFLLDDIYRMYVFLKNLKKFVLYSLAMSFVTNHHNFMA